MAQGHTHDDTIFAGFFWEHRVVRVLALGPLTGDFADPLWEVMHWGDFKIGRLAFDLHMEIAHIIAVWLLFVGQSSHLACCH